MKNEIKKAIVLFDEACPFCNSSVQYIIKHNRKNNFLFASLQSGFAKKYFLEHKLNSEKINSIVLIQNEKIYFKSSAVFSICKNLDSYRKIFFIGILIPPIIRNFFYDYFARNRYRFVQKNNFCSPKNAALKKRFS